MTRRIYSSVIVSLAIYWLAIFTLTHLPPGSAPAVRVNDKIAHLLAYVGLTVLLDITLAHRWRSQGDWLTIVIVLCYGAVDEWTQAYVGRAVEFVDWLADGTGAAIGICLCGFCRFAWSRLRPSRRPSPCL